MSTAIGRLHVLTDYTFQQRFSHAELATLAARGGADTVQFRQKRGTVRHMLLQACGTVKACRALGVPVIINDRVDVALASGAAGVHLGQDDMPISAARRILGPDAMVGGTATTMEQALRVEDEGADYVGFGPVFPTASKRNPASTKGVDGLSAVCMRLRIPVIAIAGITAARVEETIRAGAHGVAVMTAVSTAEDPVAAVRSLRRAVDAATLRGGNADACSDGVG